MYVYVCMYNIYVYICIYIYTYVYIYICIQHTYIYSSQTYTYSIHRSMIPIIPHSPRSDSLADLPQVIDPRWSKTFHQELLVRISFRADGISRESLNHCSILRLICRWPTPTFSTRNWGFPCFRSAQQGFTIYRGKSSAGSKDLSSRVERSFKALKTVMLRSLENSSNPGRAPGCRVSEHVELLFIHRRKGLHWHMYINIYGNALTCIYILYIYEL